MWHRLRLPVSRGKVGCIVTVVSWRRWGGSVARWEDWIIFPWNDWLYANRPTNERAEDGDLIRAQVNVLSSFQPFLRFTASLGLETETCTIAGFACMLMIVSRSSRFRRGQTKLCCGTTFGNYGRDVTLEESLTFQRRGVVSNITIAVKVRHLRWSHHA